MSRSALVIYSPAQMYALVNDIAAYPQFLPWCKGSEILKSTEAEISAALEVKKGILHHQFSTRNTLTPDAAIDMHLIDGPFKQLEGHWQFGMIGDNQGCRVSLDMDFEFSNQLLSSTLSPVFSQITGSMVDAFCQRAQVIYG